MSIDSDICHRSVCRQNFEYYGSTKKVAWDPAGSPPRQLNPWSEEEYETSPNLVGWLMWVVWLNYRELRPKIFSGFSWHQCQQACSVCLCDKEWSSLHYKTAIRCWSSNCAHPCTDRNGLPGRYLKKQIQLNQNPAVIRICRCLLRFIIFDQIAADFMIFRLKYSPKVIWDIYKIIM